MKYLLSIFLAMTCHAATTNFVFAIGNIMSGQDNQYNLIDPSQLSCATGGLVTNGTPGIFVRVTDRDTTFTGGPYGSVQQMQFYISQGLTNIFYFQFISPYQCTNSMGSTNRIILSGGASGGNYTYYLSGVSNNSICGISVNNGQVWTNSAGDTNFVIIVYANGLTCPWVLAGCDSLYYGATNTPPSCGAVTNNYPTNGVYGSSTLSGGTSPNPTFTFYLQ